jgi:hypothetical protein
MYRQHLRATTERDPDDDADSYARGLGIADGRTGASADCCANGRTDNRSADHDQADGRAHDGRAHHRNQPTNVVTGTVCFPDGKANGRAHRGTEARCKCGTDTRTDGSVGQPTIGWSKRLSFCSFYVGRGNCNRCSFVIWHLRLYGCILACAAI